MAKRKGKNGRGKYPKIRQVRTKLKSKLSRWWGEATGLEHFATGIAAIMIDALDDDSARRLSLALKIKDLRYSIAFRLLREQLVEAGWLKPNEGLLIGIEPEAATRADGQVFDGKATIAVIVRVTTDMPVMVTQLEDLLPHLQRRAKKSGVVPPDGFDDRETLVRFGKEQWFDWAERVKDSSEQFKAADFKAL